MEDIKMEEVNVTTIEDLTALEKQKEEIENKIKEARQALKSRNVGTVTIIKHTNGISNVEEYYSIKILGTSYNRRTEEIYPRYCSIFSYKTKEESIKYIDQTITCLTTLKNAINANEQDKYMDQDCTDYTVDTDKENSVDTDIDDSVDTDKED